MSQSGKGNAGKPSENDWGANKNNRGRGNVGGDNTAMGEREAVANGNSVVGGSESIEIGRTETSSESSELSPKQKDPLEARSVSLRRSQWQWLDELTVAHAMKSASVFLREWIDKIRKEDNEQD